MVSQKGFYEEQLPQLGASQTKLTCTEHETRSLLTFPAEKKDGGPAALPIQSCKGVRQSLLRTNAENVWPPKIT